MFDFKKIFIDLLFPIECLGCRREGKWLCQDCFDKIKINFESQPYQSENSSALNGVWTATDYSQALVAKTLQSFKYNFIVDLGEILGELLVKFLAAKMAENSNLSFDVVTAVPLSKKRSLWRGFNQAEILARQVSKNFGWPIDFGLIRRRHHNRPQVGLKAAERLANTKGIFEFNQKQLKYKKILLIDDVITTGATMQECAKVLKAAGAEEIWGLVIAKG